MPSPRAPLTVQQMFSSLVPKVEITKVTLDYERTGGYQGTDPKTLEAIFDRNPHIDVDISGLGTQRQRAERSERLASSTDTKVTVDLQIKMQQGLNAFPSVLNESQIRQAMKIHVCWLQNQNEFNTLIQQGAASAVDSLQTRNQIVSMDFSDWQGSDEIPDFVIFEGSQKLEVYNHQVSFTISGEVSNLGILTCSELIPSRLQGALNPPVLAPLASLSGLVGPLDSLWVLEGGAISSTSIIFVTHDNDPWTGPVLEVNAAIQNAIDNDPDIIRFGTSLGYEAEQSRILRESVLRSEFEHIRRATKFLGTPVTHRKPVLLKRKVIQIPKVQDFRISHKIEALSMDFSITENDIFANLKKDLRGERIKIDAPKANFSDIFLSRDIGNNCRFFFSINWKRIILENSIFGKLFEEATEDELNNLLDRCSIKSLKVLRHRVGGSGEIGSKPTSKPFEENEIPAFIVGSKDEPFGTPSKYKLATGLNQPAAFHLVRSPIDENGQRGWLVEKENFFSEWVLQEATQGGIAADRLRHFTGVDGFVKAKTDGYYKYEAQLECFDKSIELIDEKHTKLLEHIDIITYYYKQATRLSSRELLGTSVLMPSPTPQHRGVAPWMSPYIDLPGGESEYEPGQIHTGAFDLRTNRFSDSFRTNWTEPPTHTLKQSLQDTLDNVSLDDPGFIQILKFFSNKKTIATGASLWDSGYEQQIKNALVDYLNPYSATPESINIVLQLMQTVASKIGSILGVVYKEMGYTNSTTQREPAVRKRHITAKNRSFKIDNQSSSVFNANLMRNLGFDFLNTTDLSKTTQMQPGKTEHMFQDDWHNEWIGVLGNSHRPAGLYEIPIGHIQQESENELIKLFESRVGNLPSLVGANPIDPNIPWHSIQPTFNVRTTENTYFTPHTIVLPSDANPASLQYRLGNRIHTSQFRGSMPFFEPRMFLPIISRSLYGRPATSKTWLIDIIDGTGIPSMPLVNPLHTSNTDWTRVSTANDLASYFTLYHNVVINWLNGSQLNPTPDFSSRDEGDRHYRGSRADDLFYRCAMYPTFAETIEQVEFDSVRSVSETRVLVPQIKENRIEKSNSYNLLNPTSKISEMFRDLKGSDGITSATDVGKQLVLDNAPNQIKALIWNFGADGADANRPLSRGFAAPFMDVTVPENSDPAVYMDVGPAFDYTTQIINRMEGLTSYDLDRQTGQIFLNKPIWSPLNENARTGRTTINLLDAMVSPQIRNTFGRANLLCRSLSYSDEKYLIRRNKNYDLPVYDEYFITVPG